MTQFFTSRMLFLPPNQQHQSTKGTTNQPTQPNKGHSLFTYVACERIVFSADAVGWASGRASGLQKLSDEVLVWLSVWSEVQIVCIWSS